MRAVVQRVSSASVRVEEQVVGAIGTGVCVLLGVEHHDCEGDADYLARKIAGLRIFPDGAHKMNRSLLDVGGSALVISQFTLYGDTRKGMRPSFDRAARPEHASQLYQRFVMALRSAGVSVQTGVFQAMMQVSLVNEGPVTLICESSLNRAPKI